MECELSTLQLFGANWNFVTLSGICDEIGCIKFGLDLEVIGINCVANGVFDSKESECDANALLRICEFECCNVGNCGANGRFYL